MYLSHTCSKLTGLISNCNACKHIIKRFNLISLFRVFLILVCLFTFFVILCFGFHWFKSFLERIVTIIFFFFVRLHPFNFIIFYRKLRSTWWINRFNCTRSWPVFHIWSSWSVSCIVDWLNSTRSSPILFLNFLWSVYIICIYIFIVDIYIIMVVICGTVLLKLWVKICLKLLNLLRCFILFVENHHLIHSQISWRHWLCLVIQISIFLLFVSIYTLKITKNSASLAEKYHIQLQKFCHDWVNGLLFVLSQFNHLIVTLIVANIKSHLRLWKFLFISYEPFTRFSRIISTWFQHNHFLFIMN